MAEVLGNCSDGFCRARGSTIRVCAHVDIENLIRQAQQEHQHLSQEDDDAEGASLDSLEAAPCATERSDQRDTRVGDACSTFSSPPGNIRAGGVEKARRKDATRRRKSAKRVLLAKQSKQPLVPRHVLKKSVQKRVSYPAVDVIAMDTKSFPISQGSWVGMPDKKKEKLWTLADLQAEGFRLIEWDGITPYLLVDKQDRVVTFLAGRPQDPEWNAITAEAARLLTHVQNEEKQHACFDTPNLRRGEFLAINAGISYGGGRQEPGNVKQDHSAIRLSLVESILRNFAVRRIAGFQSSVFALYAPKAFRHVATVIVQLVEKYPSLRLNFPSTSVYPTMAFNCGPKTECLVHRDYSNAPGSFCTITSLGNFDAKRGGHFILWQPKLVIEFPSGSTVGIPSALIAHGNTPIQPHENRMSVTQYCPGGLLRWVAYGFQAAKKVLLQPGGRGLKENMDGSQADGLERTLGLFSKVYELKKDRESGDRI